MDIQSPSRWAKSTESKIEMFLDDFIIRSTSPKIRATCQKLLLSLFTKGNQVQKSRIINLILSRTENLLWMGKASQDFLLLIKNIFSSTTAYEKEKWEIINEIFNNFQKIHLQMLKNSNYQFYSFAANLIDFGNEQFKPYLLQANGCLNCYGKTQNTPEFLKLQNVLQTHSIFTNKLEFIFKRYYQIKDLSINLKTNNRYRSVSIYYRDLNNEYHRIGNKDKYKPGQSIPHENLIKASGVLFEFDVPNTKKHQCVFCDAKEQINCICSNCPRRSDKIDISGVFKIIGADEKKISDELCEDYQKLRNNIASIKSLHAKMESKQKISLHFGLDEMAHNYGRIIKNLSLLHMNESSSIPMKENKDCFSCSYYEIVNILSFLKSILSQQNSQLPLQTLTISTFKSILTNCIKNSQIQSLKSNMLEVLASFIISSRNRNYEQEIMKFPKTADIISQILITLKEKKNGKNIDEDLGEIRELLKNRRIVEKLTISERVRIFVCYYLDWEYLGKIENFNYNIEVNRLNEEQIKQLSVLLDFDLSLLFNENLNGYLRAFLKILPSSMLPPTNLDITDSQFLQYIDNKVPQIDEQKIKNSIIACPMPIIKLDMFVSLPTLISKLQVKDSMKLMNSLFPYRQVWNLNIIAACKNFQIELEKLPAEEQLYTCLEGYCKSYEELYIEKIHKLLVPVRMNFIIRLDTPNDEIEQTQIQYPFIPIREVRSQDLQGDNIKALHDWVYNQLVKLNQGMPLDIIVEKNIIDNMDLPIEVVFQEIAQNKDKRKIGNKQYDFFRVIYRIQGILGEPKQRSIGNPRDQKLQACIERSSYFLNRFQQDNKNIGLDVLMNMLKGIQPGRQSQKNKILLFQILSTLSMNEGICKKIVEGEYGDSIINATVRLMSFENEKDAKITNFLLQLSSRVIDEANKEMINLRKGSMNQMRKTSDAMDVEGDNTVSDSEKKVRFVLERFNQCQMTFEKTGNILYKDIAKRLIKLLPFCSKDEIQPTNMLFNFFEVASWSTKSSSKMEYLLIWMESLSESYMTFKSIVRESGVTDEIIKSILNGVRKEGEETVDEKKLSQNKSVIESALLLLCSLVQGDESLQNYLFEKNIFHNIYEISQIPPKKSNELNAGRVPQNSYKIIKYFSEGKIVDPKISEFLSEKKKEEKALVAPKKNKKWEMMKNKQKKAMTDKIEEEQEKDLITCSSCYEGYSKRKDILGLYIYLTKNQIPQVSNWWKDNRKNASFTSTTYFTAIHFECHMRAYEADQKISRSQWDGALIRNSDVLCNGWIPFKGPKTTSEQFSRTQKKYFERNKNGNYWNAITDLNGLLQKLSIQFDFATESKGSSSSHNCRYIPILIAFSSHLTDRNNNQKSLEQGVKFLLQNPPKKQPLINLFLCSSIFVTPYKMFRPNIKTYFSWILSSIKKEQNEEYKFADLKPHLLYLKIVEQIYEIIHSKLDEESLQVHKKLDAYIPTNLPSIVQEFEALNERYKTQYTKYTTMEQFEF